MTGRWPRAIFYDSKTTLFDWAWSWRTAAERIVATHGNKADVDAFYEDWVVLFEGCHRRAAFSRYADLTRHIETALGYAYRMHGITGDPAKDVRIYLDLQKDVQPFPEVVDALQEQRALGVKIIIFSDVETEYIEGYVSKLRGFRPDFVGSTEQARVHKPNPRVYAWVLKQVGLDPGDVIYCAAPQFDIQGALACGIRTAWLRRAAGKLGNRNITFQAADAAPDYEIEDLHQLTSLLRANLHPAAV